jgi:hypothetical protein
LDISNNTKLGSLSCAGNPGDGVSKFPVKSQFDNNSVPAGFQMPLPGGSWEYEGKTITADYGGEINIVYPIEGTAGDFTCSLSEDGTMTVSGEGAITSYASPNNHTAVYANEYATKIKTIIVSEGITSIGRFANFENLESISFPESLETIEPRTFANCDALTSVVIPDGVTSIGESTFMYCRNLRKVVIGDGVKRIEKFAFWNCNAITDLTIGNSVEFIGEVSLGWCGFSSIIIPASVKTIESIAFGGNCTDVTIMATMPPAIIAGNYSDIAFEHFEDTLYVPKGCLEAYLADPLWCKNFNVGGIYDSDETVNIVEQP